jgi:hypothetical protein
LLVDTNIFIEVSLNQASAVDARTFLENRKGHDLYVSDFALHSIGLLLFRQRPGLLSCYPSEPQCGGMATLTRYKWAGNCSVSCLTLRRVRRKLNTSPGEHRPHSSVSRA